jgi:excisionase family DNA binding protein
VSHLSPRLTVAEVASELRTSQKYVRALIRRGEIGHVREGRLVFVTRAQVEDYCLARIVSPKAAGPSDHVARVARGKLKTVPTSLEEKRLRAEALARERGWK